MCRCCSDASRVGFTHFAQYVCFFSGVSIFAVSGVHISTHLSGDCAQHTSQTLCLAAMASEQDSFDNKFERVLQGVRARDDRYMMKVDRAFCATHIDKTDNCDFCVIFAMVAELVYGPADTRNRLLPEDRRDMQTSEWLSIRQVTEACIAMMLDEEAEADYDDPLSVLLMCVYEGIPKVKQATKDALADAGQ